MSNQKNEPTLEHELTQIKLELEQLRLKSQQSKADRKLLFAVSILMLLTVLSIKFELRFQDGETSGSISSDFSSNLDKTLQALAALGVIGAGAYAAPAALKSAQLRDSRIDQSPINSEETK